MYPSWLTVEYASTRFISLATSAMDAANTAVTAPITATRVDISDCWNNGKNLATRNTPAVTIVAECIRADTDVGPSIASGNHECNGNWADFPTAPIKNPRAIQVATDVAINPPLTAAYIELMSNHDGFWEYR